MDPLTEITTYEEATESFKEIKQQEITVKHSLYHLDATQLKTTANTLLKVIQDSRILALKVSKDVNLLDKKQQKIRSCLDLIDSYSSCIRWSSSFHSLSIPDKCHVAHLFLALDSSLLSNLFTPLETDSHPIQVLHSQISHLETELINQFDAAINAGNDEMILDTFKLFPLVNMHNIGIDRFGGFLCGGVGNVVTEGIKGVSDKGLS